MSIPAPFHGWLIGENGERVKTMEQQYSVKIHYNSKEETAGITGAPRDVSNAQDQLKSVCVSFFDLLLNIDRRYP